MLDRLLLLPLGIAIGLVSWHLGLGYVGLGILFGITILVFDAWRGESYAPAFETGVLLAVVGGACYWISFYWARKHGMSVEELSTAKDIPRFLRRLPSWGIVTVTMGVVLIVADIASRRDGM